MPVLIRLSLMPEETKHCWPQVRLDLHTEPTGEYLLSLMCQPASFDHQLPSVNCHSPSGERQRQAPLPNRTLLRIVSGRPQQRMENQNHPSPKRQPLSVPCSGSSRQAPAVPHVVRGQPVPERPAVPVRAAPERHRVPLPGPPQQRVDQRRVVLAPRVQAIKVVC